MKSLKLKKWPDSWGKPVNELRRKRVESLIRDLVSTLIMRGEVKDPRVSTLISVTRVEVAKDLTTARVYMSSIQSDQALEESVNGLNSAAGFMQRAIAPNLRMRSTPKLKFYVDRSLKDGFEVTQKLNQLNNEDQSPDTVE